MIQRTGRILVAVAATHVAAAKVVTEIQMDDHKEDRRSPRGQIRFRERWVGNLIEIAWGIFWDKMPDWTLGRAPHWDFRHGHVLVDVKSVDGKGNLLVNVSSLESPDHAHVYVLGSYLEDRGLVEFIGWAWREDLLKLESQESLRNQGDYKLMDRDDLADNWEIFRYGG
jgi:hypothetical protein